jgi:uncharacterized protein
VSQPGEADQPAAIREGLAAWAGGDLDALERVLDPAVTLRALRSGPWDCDNRDQVMHLLRRRAAERPGTSAPPIAIQRLDESTFRVTGIGGSEAVATLVKVADGKVVSMRQVSTDPADPHAEAAVAAIRSGDVAALVQVLAEAPNLAGAPVPGYQGRTLLHVATDWPGYLPNAPEIVRVLIEHGADPNHRGGNNTTGETPLHWAASSDDVDVARALLDGGADPEAPDGSIGSPLDNAIGYSCWHVAELLAASGARIDKLWHAAALGRLDRLETLLASNTDEEQISQAFWHACAASQRRAAERLLDAGADLAWVPDYAEGSPLDAATETPTRQQNVIDWLKERGATSANSAG